MYRLNSKNVFTHFLFEDVYNGKEDYDDSFSERQSGETIWKTKKTTNTNKFINSTNV